MAEKENKSMHIEKKHSVLMVLMLGMSCFATDYQVRTQAEFDAVKKRILQPGDAILLERGKQFTGMLSPTGTGTEAAPIRVGAYGAGARPQIHAGGTNEAAVRLCNPSCWEVQGLELTNTDGSDNDQGALFGIYVCAEGVEGTYTHVYIDNCYVHHVNGKVAGKGRGGIHIRVADSLQKTIFDDLRITNNRIEDVGGVGIENSARHSSVDLLPEGGLFTKNLWTRVYVGGNVLNRTGRNCIIARASLNAIYEHNILANSSRYDSGHSIFCFNTDGIKIQHNEAYGNVGDKKNNNGGGESDRGGFDADYNCVNTYIQYNYSHDNLWFCGIMKRPTRNVVIRYNISQNDREGIYFYGFEKNKSAENVHIYNNTHFVKKGLHVSVFAEGRTPINTTFENNIFFFEEKGEWGKNATGINTVFRNNLYYNITPHSSDTQPIMAAPGFIKPGAAGSNINLKTMDALRGYQLQAGSPGINRAIPVSNNGGRDIVKTAADPAESDIGAFEYQATGDRRP